MKETFEICIYRSIHVINYFSNFTRQNCKKFSIFFTTKSFLVIKCNTVNINLHRLFPNIYTSIKIKNG